MGLEDAGDGGPASIAHAISSCSTLLPALQPHFQVELLSFGDAVATATPESLDAKAGHSDLGAALAAAGALSRPRGRRASSSVGRRRHRAGADAGAMPPVFAIGVGSPAVARDREVLSVTAAEAVFDDSRIDLAVSAVSHGHGVDPIRATAARERQADRRAPRDAIGRGRARAHRLSRRARARRRRRCTPWKCRPRPAN